MAPAGYSTPFVFASFLFMFQNFFIAIAESTYIVSPTWTLAALPPGRATPHTRCRGAYARATGVQTCIGVALRLAHA